MESVREDETGLWEVIWSMNTKWPTVTEEEKRRLAAVAMGALLDRGWVSLFKSRSSETQQPKVGLSDAALRGALLRKETWMAPSDVPWGYYAKITDKGHREFKW